MNPPVPAPGPPSRPLLLLLVITLAGWLSCGVWPRVLAALGVTDYGRWYLDSYAVLAAVDAVRAGVDPNSANPLDPFLRNHKYSDWWFALRWLGLTREYNFALGSAWIAAFLAAVGWTARPRTLREAGWLAVLLVSPPVLLAVNRANNDLVIFVLLALCGVAAVGATWGRQVFAVGALVLATGLKFYPAPAALAFLWARPLRRMPALLLLALTAAGLALASVWAQVAHAQFTIEFGARTSLGAPLLGRALGWPCGGLAGLCPGAAGFAGRGRGLVYETLHRGSRRQWDAAGTTARGTWLHRVARVLCRRGELRVSVDFRAVDGALAVAAGRRGRGNPAAAFHAPDWAAACCFSVSGWMACCACSSTWCCRP